jgi:ACS family sodium-dependent inorganic phosphate cotransporter
LQNGLLSSLPYLGKYVFAVLTSALADYLMRTGRLSRTATRKIFTAFGKGRCTGYHQGRNRSVPTA